MDNPSLFSPLQAHRGPAGSPRKSSSRSQPYPHLPTARRLHYGPRPRRSKPTTTYRSTVLSEAELSCLLPETDPTRLPRLRKFAAICPEVAIHSLPAVYQNSAADPTMGGALSPPPSQIPSGTSVAAAPAAHEPRRHGAARALCRRARPRYVHPSPPPLPIPKEELLLNNSMPPISCLCWLLIL